jgi:hypothetical protein
MVINDERLHEILIGRDISAILGLISEQEQSTEPNPDIAVRALRQLEALFFEGLPKLVARICTSRSKDVAWRVRHFFMNPWLARDGYFSRGAVIDLLVEALADRAGDRVVPAIQTAWVIGYRDEKLEDKLLYIAGIDNGHDYDDDAEGYALTALSSMAYYDHFAIQQKLASRILRRGTLAEPDCWTAITAATPSLIEPLVAVAKEIPVAPHALLALPVRFPGSALAVWKAFLKLDNNCRVGQVGNASRSLDLEAVSQYLVGEVLKTIEDIDNRNLLFAANQLNEANLPKQLKDLQETRDRLGESQLELFRQIAVKPTGNAVKFQTSESLNKESIWQIILRLGLSQARKWLPDALKDEVNFTVLDLAEIAAFLQIGDSAEALSAIIDDESIELGIRIGCLRHLGVLGTKEALIALIASPVRIVQNGTPYIPRDMVEAIVSACMSLKDSTLVWETVQSDKYDRTVREACAYAIADLSNFTNPPIPSPDLMVGLLRAHGPSLPGYDQIVAALAPFGGDDETLTFLREIAATLYESKEVLETLAITGVLAEFPDRISRLGLIQDGTGWTVKGPLTDAAAFALVQLFKRDPAFEPALRYVITEGSFSEVIQITSFISSADLVSDEVRDLLWSRACQRNGPNSSERSTLEAVAKIWPQALLREGTVQLVSQWSSSAKRAYLACFDSVEPKGSYAHEIATTASHFLSDPNGDVRRDAARLARRTDANVLSKAVDHFVAFHSHLDKAVFGLDAAVWLDDQWLRIKTIGEGHREPLVRKRTEELSKERADSALAAKYAATVLQSKDYLETWCYGQAIVELGNEDTLEMLTTNLPPEVYRRHYLNWLSEELEKRLEKRRSNNLERTELPAPASHDRKVSIHLDIGTEKLGPFDAMLRETHERNYGRRTSSWLVQIEDQPDLALKLQAAGDEAEIPIETSDGHKGRVLPILMTASWGLDTGKSLIRLLGKGELL